MRVLLARIDPTSGRTRAIEMTVQSDLLGWHILTIRWGLAGRMRAERTEVFACLPSARARVAEQTLCKVQRGYGPATRARLSASTQTQGSDTAVYTPRRRTSLRRDLHRDDVSDRQLMLDLPHDDGEAWADRVLEACFASPSLGEQLYAPSFRQSLSRLYQYRDATSAVSGDGRVVRLVPRTLQAFLPYSTHTFFADDGRLHAAVQSLAVAGIETVADLVQWTPDRLTLELGLTQTTIRRLRMHLARVGLDLGMRSPRPRRRAS